jgi:membrane dipeptidase
MNENGVGPGDPKTKAFLEAYGKDHPTVYATIDDVVAHIEHVIGLTGVDHVGFGSDFDGVGDSLPRGLEDVSKYPNLIAKLLEKGHTDEDIEKICSKNLFRVWRAVEAIAAAQPQRGAPSPP